MQNEQLFQEIERSKPEMIRTLTELTRIPAIAPENGGNGEFIDEILFYAQARQDGITNSNIVNDSQARSILKKKHPKVAII